MQIDLDFVADGFDSFRECESHWSKVVLVKGGGDEAKAALDFLLKAFYRPINRSIRAICPRWLDSSDLTQDFLVHIVEKELILKADRAKGSFRSYLKTALRNWVFDAIERERIRRGLSLESVQPQSRGDTAEEVLDREFAIEVFREAKQAARPSGADNELGRRIWELFCTFELEHNEGKGKAQEEVAKQFGLTPDIVSRMVDGMRGCFRSEVRKRLQGGVADGEELQVEIAWWIEQAGKALRQS